MNWFETLITLLKTPQALIHIAKIQFKINRNQKTIYKLRKQKNALTNKATPPITTIKSYFWASRFIPNSNCLPRSLALYQKLTTQGYLVNHKIGGQSTNQQMHVHAWVEYDELPINESKEIKSQFSELTSYEH